MSRRMTALVIGNAAPVMGCRSMAKTISLRCTPTPRVRSKPKNSSLRLNRVIDMPEKTVVDQASGLKPPTAFAERGQGLPAAGVSTRRRQQADFRFDVGAGANALTFGRFQNAEG